MWYLQVQLSGAIKGGKCHLTERLSLCWEQLVFVTFDFIHAHTQRVSLLYSAIVCAL